MAARDLTPRVAYRSPWVAPAEQKNDEPEKSKEHSQDQSKKKPYSTPVFKELTEQPDAFSWVQRKKKEAGKW